MEYPFDIKGRFTSTVSISEEQFKQLGIPALHNKKYVYIQDLYAVGDYKVDYSNQLDDYKYYPFALYNYDGEYMVLINNHCGE